MHLPSEDPADGREFLSTAEFVSTKNLVLTRNQYCPECVFQEVLSRESQVYFRKASMQYANSDHLGIQAMPFLTQARSRRARAAYLPASELFLAGPCARRTETKLLR